MPSNDSMDKSFFDQPFPLQRHFRRRVIPGLVVFTFALMMLAAYGAKVIMEQIYLDMAQRSAAAIERAVSRAAPQAWKALLSGKAEEKLKGQPAHDRMIGAFDDEVVELNLVKLKVYDLNGLTVYSTEKENIGVIETGAALKSVLGSAKPGLVLKVYPNGLRLYELYVPLLDSFGQLKAVVELYEPVTYLNTVILREVVPAAVVPLIMLIALIFGLGFLVKRAQKDIITRTNALKDLSRRLETFVSASALSAAREADPDKGIQSSKVRCTLLFTDVRDFTGFSEEQPPERVVKFLNDLMRTQVAVIQSHGGDVDKMIGDAVLACFFGDNAEQRAILAGLEILTELEEGFLPRGVGIGIYSGDVISGAIGPVDRRDFTVIGDSVNVSARLCSLAARGELVVDSDSLELAGEDAGNGFGVPETVTVKGRADDLSVRRWRLVNGT